MTNKNLIDEEIMTSDMANNDNEVPENTSPQEQSSSYPKHNLTNSASESSDDESDLILNRKNRLNNKNSSSDSSDAETGLTLKQKRSVKRFSDSDSDIPKETSESVNDNISHNNQDNSDDEESIEIFKSTSKKSRIRKISISEGDSESEQQVTKNTGQQLRMKNKKMKDKFKNLLNSRSKDSDNKHVASQSKENSGNESSNYKDDITSIEKIKQIIKERPTSLKMSICDTDTSDEESSQYKKGYKPKKEIKRTKLTSPKPQRMSAKQAMENMHKIKSESNRMLREKEVSLPYHRPKALSLQDIMKRRRPAVSSDGKAFPIKMNEDQLKQYALMLEERQKEMMELCKSDTDEDEPEETNEDLENKNINDKIDDEASASNNDKIEEVEKAIEETTQLLLEEKESIDIECETSKESSQPCNDESKEIMRSEVTNCHDTSMDFKTKSADVSGEMELVYNDSIVEDKDEPTDTPKGDTGHTENKSIEEKADQNNDIEEELHEADNSEMLAENVATPVPPKNDNEMESQLISLQYLDSETTEIDIEDENILANKEDQTTTDSNKSDEPTENKGMTKDVEISDFPDEDMDMGDINMDEIDSIIEKAEIIKNTCEGVDSPALVRDITVLNVKPKLAGTPGMVIDLDGTDPVAPKKSGVELLKERFTFFAKLKTPEEKEREREKRQKPGTLHLKLKQELEDKIAEQRSLEWSKRLDNEKQHQKELDAIRGDESDPEDDIDKIEAKLDENDVEQESSSEGEEEPIEDDVILEDKPKKKNPLLADEAEESDGDEADQNGHKEGNDDEVDDNVEGDVSDDDEGEMSENDSNEEDSSESEDELEFNKPKKGRILKAFEDSDDEDIPKLNSEETSVPTENVDASETNNPDVPVTLQSQSDIFTDSQDDVIQLAQVPKQISGELLTSSDLADSKSQVNDSSLKEDEVLGTQTFSILSTMNATKDITADLDDSDKIKNATKDIDMALDGDKLTVISETQPFNDNLDAVVGMCSGSFSQNCIEFQPPTTQSQPSQSQPIGEDLLNMCTGNFYDNQFVSLLEDNKFNTSDELSQDPTSEPPAPKPDEISEQPKKQDDILKSVLDELDEPETKSLKFFFDGKSQNKENEQNMTNTQQKKRFVIDSDDETNNKTEDSDGQRKKKKLKKKKPEKRALQISDDEEDEYSEPEEGDAYLSDNNENEEEKLVEYDSEENEVEVNPQIVKKKKKKKASEFFEQEAELTSEDEWVGSGDEDEAGLDRLEREAGDDDCFHHARLQAELGQIHMRDLLDQDKREVRLIQELLFEDGDLGAGGRQRKFRWRNADGEEMTGTAPDEFADTQEEEFESEEQWRKQRHEREMFLRQMKNEGENDADLNVSVNRTTIIKANLNSKTMSSLLEEVNQTKTEVATTIAVSEKKTAKDIPSPKKPFPVFQQTYHGSLLARGRGALARLAALAGPLAAGADALPVSTKRNFVFAAITPEDEPKVTKRKADTNVGTPRLVKKMKTEDKQKHTKSSLLDHLKALP